MKKLLPLLFLFAAVNGWATKVKIKVTYKDDPLSGWDITLKYGDVVLGSGTTNASGEVSINVSSLTSKTVDIYGEKPSGRGGKNTWNARNYLTLDNSNFGHLRMEEVIREMAAATDIPEKDLLEMWGLALSTDVSSSSSSGSAKQSGSGQNNDDDNKTSTASKIGKGLSKVGSMGDGIKVTTETHTSSSKSGPDGTTSSSSSSKSETKIGGGKIDHSSSSTKSNSSFDDGGFKSTRTDKSNSGSMNVPSGKKTGDKSSGNSNGNGSGSLSTAKSSGSDNSPAQGGRTEKPETAELERKKEKAQARIDELNKDIVAITADLMTLRSEKKQDSITIKYKNNDLEAAKLKKEREQIAIEKIDAKLVGTSPDKEKQEAQLNREAEIEFRLKQLEELEKASKEDRRNEQSRREDLKKESEKEEKEAAKEAREEANFDSYSLFDLKRKLAGYKTDLGMQQASAKTAITKEHRARYEAEVVRLKAKVEKYEKRIAELEAKEKEKNGQKKD